MRLILIICTLVVIGNASDTYIDVYPTNRSVSTNGSSEHDKLTRKQSISYRIVISDNNGKYLWVSRDSQELIKIRGGIFETYLSIKGSGYVKVNILTGDVMEHVNIHLATLTYWGKLK